MKTFLAFAVSLVATASAWAGNPGCEAAAKICDGLFGNADKLACIRIVEKAKHFDEGAVKICDGLFGNADKLACLSACQDKKYLPATLKVCDGIFGNKEKIKCLADGGKKVGGDELSADERDEVILTIDRALRDLDRDKIETAARRLKSLRDALEKKEKK